MVMDHLPSMYDVAFNRARETLMRGKIEVSTEEQEEVDEEHPKLATEEEQKEEFVKEMENPSITSLPKLPLELGAYELSKQVDSPQQ
ncbi:hypothetical protein K7432_016878 [Basidiobolus ranarum]|uniref:Uncharacterized protein n=1 Tax=Basidiobolus ranarum TaxID=34480 RepID=A0ABR2WE64_9FUNG